MNSRERWLHASYWLGAIVDALAALAMLDQAVFGRKSPLSDYVPEVPYRYAMGLAGSLMLGWTLLLLWADRQPIERKGILVITNVVVVGLFLSGVYASYEGLVPISRMAFLLCLQLGLVILFTVSYFRGK
ncbi:MAG TPA: hypothetical protein VGF40_03805 [Thermoanaerobaculia bacterium]